MNKEAKGFVDPTSSGSDASIEQRPALVTTKEDPEVVIARLKKQIRTRGPWLKDARQPRDGETIGGGFFVFRRGDDTKRIRPPLPRRICALGFCRRHRLCGDDPVGDALGGDVMRLIDEGQWEPVYFFRRRRYRARALSARGFVIIATVVMLAAGAAALVS